MNERGRGDLRRWRDELGLGCDLLCDSTREVALAWGAAEHADQERAARISVLVGPDGKVVKTYRSPDAPNHVDEVLRDLQQ